MVSSSQSLKRIFSSSNQVKYPTLVKYLPVLINQQMAKSDPAALPDEKDLALFESLVEQSLAKRLLDEASDQAGQNSVGAGRNKELLGQTPTAELVEQDVVSKEFAANPELADLSKEIQEISKETQEQREQALIKEKQQALDQLAAEAVIPVAISNQPVVVLPITVKSKEEAKFKSTKYSVRWLIEWCQKITKMFAGAVVYKEEIDHE